MRERCQPSVVGQAHIDPESDTVALDSRGVRTDDAELVERAVNTVRHGGTERTACQPACVVAVARHSNHITHDRPPMRPGAEHSDSVDGA